MVALDFEKTLIELSDEVLHFDIHLYLKTNNKTLLGVTMNSAANQFEELFGEFPGNYLTTINSRYVDTEAGYKVNVQEEFPSIKTKTDLFLINKDRLSDNKIDIESLLIHEICHMIIDSKNITNTSLNIDDAAKYLGSKIFKTSSTPEFHPIEFCNLLAAACISAEKNKIPKRKRLRYVNLAMKFDMNEKLK